MRLRRGPIGVILAGGQGRRIGGAKALVKLRGKPLIAYPLEVMASVLGDVVVVAKPDTELPDLPGVKVWIEPETPRHPIVGITYALAMSGGRPVVICAADLPLVSPALIDRIVHCNPAGSPCVIASHAGVIQPLLGCYQQAAAAQLGTVADRPVRELVSAIGPRLLEVGDPDELFNVNGPDDLLQATAMLDRRERAATRT
ncbi:MAG TPA: molybdenum cofactor guanylyltransferase [Solirubrobacteraceae bacterium]|nr:molybdenum cofactor guanylyltransferase [Solirubrobacteraceae bacterium]